MRARLVIALGALLTVAACSGAPSGATSSTVTVEDTSITAAPTTLRAGEITFNITNRGGTLHEVEVFTLPAGVNADAIPIVGFLADTESVGMELVGEVEAIIPDAAPTLTVTLQPGRYALICNLPGHYGLGMHEAVTVQ